MPKLMGYCCYINSDGDTTMEDNYILNVMHCENGTVEIQVEIGKRTVSIQVNSKELHNAVIDAILEE
jgi:hypothetical protein